MHSNQKERKKETKKQRKKQRKKERKLSEDRVDQGDHIYQEILSLVVNFLNQRYHSSAVEVSSATCHLDPYYRKFLP